MKESKGLLGTFIGEVFNKGSKQLDKEAHDYIHHGLFYYNHRRGTMLA
jgi:hypothetical protein